MNKKERNDLIISWLTISFAFMWLIYNVPALEKFFPYPKNIFVMALSSLIAVGTGFIFHEMGHRQVARHFGAHAEFRMWKSGLMLALFSGFVSLLSPLKFIFAAPGAVYIYGPHLGRKENGLISVAGVTINIIIGILAFISLLFVNNFLLGIILASIWQINFAFAFFNLLPIPPLDGSKVMTWDLRVWAVLFFPLLVWFISFFSY